MIGARRIGRDGALSLSFERRGAATVLAASRFTLPLQVLAPVSLDDESEPEPDLAIVPGGLRDYLHEHPARPVLAVEIADSSLSFDRRRKGSLYARAGIEDYWIVNLVNRVLEVYRDPGPDPSAYYGWRYRSVTTLAPPAAASPLAFPAIQIAVSDLLP